MRVQIEPSDIVVKVDGVECRVWNGVTEDNHQCFLFVHRILFPTGDTSDLAKQLIGVNAPQQLEQKK